MSLPKEYLEEIRKIAKEAFDEAVAAAIKRNKEAKSALEALGEKWEEDGIHASSIGLIIAPEDVEVDGKTTFTWDEAMALGKEGKIPEGWRLPTRHEWVMICEEFGQGVDGQLNPDDLEFSLELQANDNGHGHYWSSTACSASTAAYNLNFGTTSFYPQHYSLKSNGFNVRCVKEVEC